MVRFVTAGGIADCSNVIFDYGATAVGSGGIGDGCFDGGAHSFIRFPMRLEYLKLSPFTFTSPCGDTRNTRKHEL